MRLNKEMKQNIVNAIIKDLENPIVVRPMFS